MCADVCYSSFMIRFWMDSASTEDESQASWRCRVEHIQSERFWYFSSPFELANFFDLHAHNKDLWILLNPTIVPSDD